MGKKYFSGFTLIELIIVMTIIAILATLVISFLTSEVFKGNDAKRKTDIQRIKIAAEEFEKDHNCYPVSITCGVHSSQDVYPYLNNVPCDPITHASYFYVPEGSACPKWFRIFSVLQNTQDSSVTPNVGPPSKQVYNFYLSSDNAPPLAAGSSSPTPPPSGSEPSVFYGCVDGSCVPISWDNSRPGPACDPNFQDSNCFNHCGSLGNDCLPWH